MPKKKQPESDETSDLDEGNIRPTGVGLRQGEIDALDKLGEELGGISRNHLIRWAVRNMLVKYRKGELDLSEFLQQPEPPKPTLRLPGEE